MCQYLNKKLKDSKWHGGTIKRPQHVPVLDIMETVPLELRCAATLFWSHIVLGQNINSIVALGMELSSFDHQLPPLKNETNTCPIFKYLVVLVLVILTNRVYKV